MLVLMDTKDQRLSPLVPILVSLKTPFSRISARIGVFFMKSEKTLKASQQQLTENQTSAAAFTEV